MNQYICKIATIEEMNENWDYLIQSHPGDHAWEVYRKEAIEDVISHKTIVYYGILNGKIIAEATARLNPSVVQNYEGLVNETTAYLSAFRTRKEYQGQGYFSQLFHWMENDLIQRGYQTLTVGVEPGEIKNMRIYFHYGFTHYIKTANELEPAANENDEPISIVVNYYAKKIGEDNNTSGTVIAICGKIASGKSYYANQIKQQKHAVILNTDELTYAMFQNEQGENYDKLASRANEYLKQKAIEIAKEGCNVILDWGFWKKEERTALTEYFQKKNIKVEWHYIAIEDQDWEINIQERNQRIQEGFCQHEFLVTEGLKKKQLDNWEEPKTEEIDVWYYFQRQY